MFAFIFPLKTDTIQVLPIFPEVKSVINLGLYSTELAILTKFYKTSILSVCASDKYTTEHCQSCVFFKSQAKRYIFFSKQESVTDAFDQKKLNLLCTFTRSIQTFDYILQF